MEKKTTFRSRVCKYAYQIWLNTKASWSECMKRAWALYRLAKAMRAGTISFTYRKSDGTLRRASGTLRDLPAGVTFNGKKMTKPSYKTLAYWDTEKNSFRCFRVENLVSVTA